MKIMKSDKQYVEYLMMLENKDKLNKLGKKGDENQHSLEKRQLDKSLETAENLSTYATHDSSLINTRKTSFYPKINTDNSFQKNNNTSKSFQTVNNFLKTNNNFTLSYFTKDKPTENNVQTRSSFYNLPTEYDQENKQLRSTKVLSTFYNSSFNNNLNLSNISSNNIKHEEEAKFNRSTVSFNKFVNRMRKPQEKIKVGNLLHVDYASLFKRPIKINNKELKIMWDEVDHYGPRFAHCNTCFNKNLDFFENVNYKDGINIIKFIKTRKDQV